MKPLMQPPPALNGGPPSHYVAFHSVTSGLNGPDLGSDESDIVLLVFIVVDAKTKQVVGTHKYYVRPSFLDKGSSGYNNGNNAPPPAPMVNGGGHTDDPHAPPGPPGSKQLSEQVRGSPYHLTDDVLRTAPRLGEVIGRFDREASSKYPNPRLVTDGQLHVRQCLFPEAQRSGVDLPSYYYHFHDLRKEVASIAPEARQLIGGENTTLAQMAKCLGIPAEPNESDKSADSEKPPATNGSESCEQQEEKTTQDDVKLLEDILVKLICDDVKFHEPEKVQTKLEQGIRSRADAVDTNCCVRARGLPWQASDQDIAKFFVGLNVAKGGVALCLSNQGRRNGEALVLFENVGHRDMALSRHKHHIGNRYIEVYKATGEDFISVAGGNNKEAQQFLSRGGQVIIRMRGLPYDASAKQVTDFFATESKNAKSSSTCKVLDDSDGVLFVKRPDGRAAGDAFVLFAEEEDAEKALEKHKDSIGSRYIELFRSTTAEVQQVLNRTMETGGHNGKQSAANRQQQQAQAAAAAAAAAAQAAAAQAAAVAANSHHPALSQAALLGALTGQIPHLPLVPSGALPGTAQPPPTSPAITAATAAAFQTRPPAVPTSGTANTPGQPQQMITAGTKKDCIRLRGLPYEAQVEHILEFLGKDLSNNIVTQGVHMVINSQGQPSGEAFIQMSSELAAGQASQNRHNRYMGFGKKQRYIEVFQCSGEDMNLVLTGNIAGSPGVSGTVGVPGSGAVVPVGAKPPGGGQGARGSPVAASVLPAGSGMLTSSSSPSGTTSTTGTQGLGQGVSTATNNAAGLLTLPDQLLAAQSYTQTNPFLTQPPPAQLPFQTAATNPLFQAAPQLPPPLLDPKALLAQQQQTAVVNPLLFAKQTSLEFFGAPQGLMGGIPQMSPLLFNPSLAQGGMATPPLLKLPGSQGLPGLINQQQQQQLQQQQLLQSQLTAQQVMLASSSTVAAVTPTTTSSYASSLSSAVAAAQAAAAAAGLTSSKRPFDQAFPPPSATPPASADGSVGPKRPSFGLYAPPPPPPPPAAAPPTISAGPTTYNHSSS